MARKRYSAKERKSAAKAAKQAARAQGCVCDVEVRFGVLDWADVALVHDEWCPLMRVMNERPPGEARSQLVVHWPDG